MTALKRLPKKVRYYLVSVMFLSMPFLMWAAYLISTKPHTYLTGDAFLALSLMLLVVLGEKFELLLTVGVLVDVSTAVELAAVLLLPTPMVVHVVFWGILLGQLWKKYIWFQSAFNAAARMLAALVASWAYLTFGGRVPVVTHFSLGGLVVPFIVATVLHWGVSLGLISVVVSLRSGQAFLKGAYSFLKSTVLEHVALYLIGLLMAISTETAPWTLLLFVIPIGMVYLSLLNSIRIRSLTKKAVIQMADIIDSRDPYTAEHSKRVAEISRRIARTMNLPYEEVERIATAARVHDLGKLAVDIVVLEKQGKLSDSDWAQIKRHPVLGAEILKNFPNFKDGTQYVRYHHERWDGKGYPEGLKGKEIPLGARIIAVADSYDAMSIARPYRGPLPIEKVWSIFKEGAGSQWDPDVVDALFKVLGWDKDMPPSEQVASEDQGEPNTLASPAREPG